ncbi:hypothetical protein ACFSTA_14325 [Ornithinibacillus salinisoli]|uniref:Uncharacterized protein n=1 Tax=Ornithinibacillus salinisoli TaxID=1848459 RepID=A0ABW4W0J1_9BACI
MENCTGQKERECWTRTLRTSDEYAQTTDTNAQIKATVQLL